MSDLRGTLTENRPLADLTWLRVGGPAALFYQPADREDLRAFLAGLDPAHQLSTMALFAELAREGRAVFVALHDLGLAARFCTRLVVMQAGRIVADGPPGAVLRPGLLADVFNIRAFFAETGDGPVFQPLEVLS